MSLRKVSRAFFGTYQRGRLAACTGKKRSDCPYADLRGGEHNHIVTYSRAFQNFWREGFDDEKSGKPDRYIK